MFMKTPLNNKKRRERARREHYYMYIKARNIVESFKLIQRLDGFLLLMPYMGSIG